MTSFFNRFDAWRERHFDILPPWLDDQYWKTWIWHAFFAVIIGLAAGLLWHLLFSVPVRVTYLGVIFYLFRELYNIIYEDNRHFGDAAMDVLVPWIVVFALRWWLA